MMKKVKEKGKERQEIRVMLIEGEKEEKGQ